MREHYINLRNYRKSFMVEWMRALVDNVYLLKRVARVQSSSQLMVLQKDNEIILTMGVEFSLDESSFIILAESSQQKNKSRVPQNYGVVQTIHIIVIVVSMGI